jgi:putative sigma-54 modulation protein
VINKIELAAIHINANDDIRKYARKKIAKLDDYMPRHARKSAHAEIKIEEFKAKNKKQCTAEVTIYIPGEVITARETTVNMYAAIDIVEEKLKTQLRRYKSLTSGKSGMQGRVIRKFLGKITRKK